MPHTSCSESHDESPSIPSASRLSYCIRGHPGLHAPSQKQVPLQLRQVPKGEVFQPPRKYLQHLEPMDFLGKAKVNWGVFQLGYPAAKMAVVARVKLTVWWLPQCVYGV